MPASGFAGNFAAHADFHRSPFLLKKFLQQKRAPQPGMNHPEEMKAHTVASAEINGKRGRFGATNQTHGCIAPRLDR